jgi:hypothetical protein
MSTLYLLDAHNATVADSRITDVQIDPDGAENLITGATINGSFPVFIPSGIIVEQVRTVDELNTAKFADLLALYPGFSYIAYEDFLASPSVSSNCYKCRLGERVTTNLGSYGIFETTPTSLSATPNDAIVIWEVFEIVETISENRVLLTLNELDPSTLTAEASFNGGADYQTYLSGVVGTIPLAEQGSSLVMKFTSTTLASKYLASWAVLY